MEEKAAETIRKKIVTGVIALTTRTFFIQLFTFLSTFILTILLAPSVFGIFFLVSAVISFLSYFSDIGLAAALIQKKEEPTEKELASVFTVQQILVGSSVLLVFIFSKSITIFYNLSPGGLFLLRSLLLSFFLSSLKTIPSILLERKLEFSKLVIPQVLETVVFYTIAIFLAYLGFAEISFGYAAIARGLVGLITIYLISPWKISLSLNLKYLKRLFTFGVPFQANSLLALVKDDLLTIFLGKILPLQEIGFIGWAKKWAEAPLRLIMDSIMRVTFPAFARIQEEKQLLAKAMSKAFFFLALMIFPSTILLILFIKPLVFLIPKYLKWEPALFSFYLFAVSSVFSSFSSPSTNALNALGKIKITLVLMIVWTLMTWILVPTFIFIFGFNGFAIASVIIALTGIIPVVIIKNYISFPVIKNIYKPLTLSLFIGVLGIILHNFINNLLLLFIVIGTTITLYLIFSYVWLKKEIIPYMPKFGRSK